MPVVTRLEQQKKNKDRVNVYLDDVFAFGLNIMDAALLRKGQELTEADIARLRDADQIVKAIDKGVNLLSYRPRSIKEVRDKLSAKFESEAIIDAAIQHLTERGYLDDRQFARFWIEDRIRHKPRGHQALRHELRQKGIADSIMNELLDDLVDENTAAYDAAQPRIRRGRGQTVTEFKKKTGAFLQRRGFRYDVVRQVLDTIVQEVEQENPDFFAQTDDTPY